MSFFSRLRGRGSNIAAGTVIDLSDRTGTADPIPKKWEEQAKKAAELALANGAIKKGLATWRALVVGGPINVACPHDPKAQEVLRQFFRQKNVELFVRAVFNQAFTRGEGVGFKAREDNDGNKISRLRSINPVSMDAVRKDGQVTELYQFPPKPTGGVDIYGKKELWTSKKDDVFFLRFDAPEWAKHGTSSILPAFEDVEILNDLRKADRSISKRWATVLRLLRIGGVFGRRVILPNKAQLKDATKQLSEMDQNQALATPPYWEVKTYGAEGIALNTAPRIRMYLELIALDLGLFPVFLTGDSKSFATARALLKVLRSQIHEFRLSLREMLDWIFSPDELARMGLNPDLKIDFVFSRLDIDAEQWEKELLVKMRQDGDVSLQTVQTEMNLDPEKEKALLEDEKSRTSKLWKPKDIIDAHKAGAPTPFSETPPEKKTEEDEQAPQEAQGV